MRAIFTLALWVCAAHVLPAQTRPRTLSPATSSITGITPDTATAGGGGFTLFVYGSGFQATATIYWNSTALSTSFNGVELTGTVSAALLAGPGSVAITVVNPGETASNSRTFTVRTGTATPGLTAAFAGYTYEPPSNAFGQKLLEFTGSGIEPGATLSWNGTSISTADDLFGYPGFDVPASLVQTPGPVSVTVTNPGGSPSNALNFTIPPVRTLSTISPTSVSPGSSAFTLTVNGTNFASGDYVLVNGVYYLTTSFVSSTQLQATVPASLITSQGTLQVWVETEGTPAGAAPHAAQYSSANQLSLTIGTTVCTFALSGSTASVGPGSFTGTVQVIAPSGCSWGASASGFAGISGASSGNGNGTLTYTVPQNPGSSSRSATLTIAGLTFTINQLNGCQFGLTQAGAPAGAPPSASVPAAGGTITLNVATFPGCSWNATTNSASASWLTLQSAGSGTGPGTVTYSVAQNPPPLLGRTGTISVGGQTTLPNSNVEATVSLGAATAAMSHPGVPAQPMLIALPPSLPVVAPSVATFAVAQAGNTPCTYSLPQASQVFPASGGTLSAKMEAPPGCGWTSSSSVSWLTPTSCNSLAVNCTSGSGNGSVAYVVAPNPATTPRTGVVTFTGQSTAGTVTQTFSVTEAGTSSSLSCVASVPTAPQVALEGRTEVLGDVLLTCTGLTTTVMVDVTLTLNTAVSNSCYSVGVFGSCLAPTDAAMQINGGPILPFPFPGGQVFGYNTLRWAGVPLAPVNGAGTLRMTGVRADASLLTPGGSQQSVQSVPITGTVNVYSSATVPVANATQTMANAVASLLFEPQSAFTSSSLNGTVVPLQFQSLANTFQSSGNIVETRLRLVLNNVPAGVQVFAPIFPNEGSTAQLYLADSCGSGGAGASGVSIGGIFYYQLTASGSGCAPSALTATWVIQSPPIQFQTWTFNLLVRNPPSNLSTLTSGLASSLAPVSGQILAGTTAAVPRYRDLSITPIFDNFRSRVSFAATTSVGSNVPFQITVTNDNQNQPVNVTVKGNIPLSVTGASIASCTFLGSPCTQQDQSTFEEDNIPLGVTAASNSQTGTAMISLDPSVADGSVVVCVTAADPNQPNATFSGTNGCVPLDTSTVTIKTNIGSLKVGIDPDTNGNLTLAAEPLTQTWVQGSKHTIGVPTPQPISAGSQYAFQSWSDSADGPTRSIIVPLANITYTANFAIQYALSTNVLPAGSGTVTPSLSGAFYNPGTVLTFTASANCFLNWTNLGTGVVLGSSTTLTYTTTSAPATVVANYGSGCGGPAPPTAAQFVPLTPCRVSDTRNPNGPLGGPFLAGGTMRTLPVPSSSCGVPANASAYSVNVTVVPRTGNLGYLTVWPTGQAQPVVSTLNSYDGSILANAAIVPAGGGGSINAFASNDTDLVIDINGYFVPPGAGSLQFYPLAPCRVVDTRNPGGPLGGPSLLGDITRSFPIPSGPCGAPGTAAAYSLNVTVVPHGDLGYLSIWPTGQLQPVVSTLNAMDGSTLANAAIVPAGTQGAVSFFATDTTDLVVDIDGYFAPPGKGGLNFYAVSPCRVVDTRNPNSALGGPIMNAATTRTFPLAGACELPGTAAAYSLNMTVDPPGPLGYLSVWPTGELQPTVSTLNDLKGLAVANAALLPAGTGGSINVFVTSTTHVIIDTNGYFQ